MPQNVDGSRLHVRTLHTLLVSTRWEPCVAFYRDFLGFPVVEERTGFVELAVSAGARIGILMPRRRGDEPPPPPPDVILSLRVDDLDGSHAELRARDPSVPDIREHPWEARVIDLRDPEGRRVELWAPLP